MNANPEPEEFAELQHELLLVFRHCEDVPADERENTISEIADVVASLTLGDGDAWLAAATFTARRQVPAEGELGREIYDEGRYTGSCHTFLLTQISATLAHAIPSGVVGSGYRWEIARHSTLMCLVEKLGAVLLSASIGRPGTFHVSDALAQTRTETASFDSLLFHLPRKCVSLAQQYRWPPLEYVKTSDVHEWLMKLPQASRAWGTGPIGRAVAALSYAACSRHRTESRILWPLVALEALYGRALDGLQRQILEKSETLLGPRTAFKKKFSSIYNERSKFVHGEMDLPFAYRMQSTETSDTFSSNVEETTNLAAAIAIATLQRLVRERRTDLEFSYRRDDPPPP